MGLMLSDDTGFWGKECQVLPLLNVSIANRFRGIYSSVSKLKDSNYSPIISDGMINFKQYF